MTAVCVTPLQFIVVTLLALLVIGCALAVCVTPLQFIVVTLLALLVIGCALVLEMFEDQRRP